MNEQKSSIKRSYALESDVDKALETAFNNIANPAVRVVWIETGNFILSLAPFTSWGYAVVFYSISTQVPVLTSEKPNQNG